MKNKFIILLTLVMVLTSVSLIAHAATFEDGIGKAEIPYGEFGVNNTAYTYTSFNMFTEAEAKAAGVPDEIGRAHV